MPRALSCARTKFMFTKANQYVHAKGTSRWPCWTAVLPCLAFKNQPQTNANRSLRRFSRCCPVTFLSPSALMTAARCASSDDRGDTHRPEEDHGGRVEDKASCKPSGDTSSRQDSVDSAVQSPCRGAAESHNVHSGMLVSFSQGSTNYYWLQMPGQDCVEVPAVHRAETNLNRMRLFGMPKGYPDTTAPGFRHFFFFSLTSSFVSNFASSIGYQSLLNGFFMASSPQLWMLKDLVPALLAAYLANRVVSYENRPKFWFVLSVFMTNVSVISDMLIPSFFPQYLLVAAITTSTVKQSAALMYMVTRAAALQHFGSTNNLAELTKKFNSFGMVTYTVATALGIAYCTYIASFAMQVVTVFVCCALNMLLSSISVSPIAFRLLNFTTMYVLLHEYINSGERRVVLSPEEVSERLGMRMIPHLKESPADGSSLIYISPPVGKLHIRSDTLEEDVLYVSENKMFMLALWEPSTTPLTLLECWKRYELPSFMKKCVNLFSLSSWRRRRHPGVLRAFGRKRLVLLVHTKCGADDFLTAYLIMYAAVLVHAQSKEALCRFLRHCHRTQAMWRAEAERFRDQLRALNWDVEVLAVDHPDFRLSDLIIPSSMQWQGPLQAAVPNSTYPSKASDLGAQQLHH